MNTFKERLKLFRWQQWTAVFEVFILSLMVGEIAGWMSPTLANLLKPNSPIQATEEQETWIASLKNICTPVGAAMGGIATSMFGSKLSLYISAIYFLISWLCLLPAKSVELIFAGLIFHGIGRGAFNTSFPLYIGEIADSKIRGGLNIFVIHGSLIGILLGNYMGMSVELWIFAVSNLGMIVFFLITFSLFPHTPHFFILRKDPKNAIISIQWYNPNKNSSNMLHSLTSSLNTNPPMPFWKSLKTLIVPVNRIILIKILILCILIQLSGINNVINYMEILLTKAHVTAIKPALLVLAMNFISIIGSWTGIYVNDKFERTSIFLVCSVMLTLAYLGWGLNYHLIEMGYDIPNLQWIVIISVVIFQMPVAISYYPIVNILISEIFPSNTKTVYVCVCVIVDSLFGFIVKKNFQLLVNYLTHKYVFYLYAGISLLAGIYAIILIPKTTGKTIQEIQSMLYKNDQNREFDRSSTHMEISESVPA